MWHFLSHCLGLDNSSGSVYLFWSGFGSDLGEVTLIGMLIAWYKNHTCHVQKCYRWGKHPFKHYILCKKHHPDIPSEITHSHIKRLHNKKEKV